MPQIILVPKAQENLKTLHDFIAKERPESAKDAVKAIVDGIDKLTIFPEMGLEHKQIIGLRTLIIPFGKSGYTVIYRWLINADVIEILKIKHDKQEQ